MEDTARRKFSFRVAFALLLVVLAMGMYLRLDKLNSVYFFSGDQGDHCMTVHRMIHEGEWPLEGPSHAYGGANYGPAYYYLNLPSYLLTGGDPRFGALTQIALGLVSILLAFSLARLCGGSLLASLVAAALLAVSPNALYMDRTMWNPHVLPFFSLFCFWYAGKLLTKTKWPFFPLALGLAILTQLHQGGLPPTVGILVGLAVVYGVRRARGEAAAGEQGHLHDAARPVPRWIDATACGVIVAGCALLYVRYYLRVAGTLHSPITPFADAQTVAGAASNLLAKLRLVFTFSEELVSIGSSVPRAVFPALWIVSVLLLIVRLPFTSAAARHQMLFLSLTLGAYVAAYSCVTTTVYSYTFSAMQPQMLILLSLLWVGGGTASSDPQARQKGLGFRRPLRKATLAALPAVPLVLIALYLRFDMQTYLSGRWWFGEHYKETRKITKWIAKDADQPFCLALIEGSGNSRVYLNYVLMRRGCESVNLRKRIPPRESTPPLLYVVARPASRWAPDLRGKRYPTKSFRTKDIEKSRIIRIEFRNGTEAWRFLRFLYHQKAMPAS